MPVVVRQAGRKVIVLFQDIAANEEALKDACPRAIDVVQTELEVNHF